MPSSRRSNADGAPPEGWDSHEGTVANELRISGRGLHTGRGVNVRILPLSGKKAERGVVFRRVGNAGILGEVKASYRAWRGHPLCSSLQAGDGVLFRTVEHVLASLLLCEIDHAIVELDAEELPILDGGAAAWIAAFRACGRAALPSRKRFIRILKPFEYRFGAKSRYLAEPAHEYHVSAATRVRGFGEMRWEGTLTPRSFFAEIAPARSYGHVLAALPAMAGGLLTGTPVLRGARPGCVAAILGNRVLGGMIVPEEFVRHRVLDMVGDFAIAGAPLLGNITVNQPSHRRNQKFMRTLLFKHKDCWEWADSNAQGL